MTPNQDLILPLITLKISDISHNLSSSPPLKVSLLNFSPKNPPQSPYPQNSRWLFILVMFYPMMAKVNLYCYPFRKFWIIMGLLSSQFLKWKSLKKIWKSLKLLGNLFSRCIERIFGFIWEKGSLNGIMMAMITFCTC